MDLALERILKSDLSDAPTEASQTAMQGTEPINEVAMLGHFSDTLSEMAERWPERALQDVSRIDAHYVSQVVTVMASWQEAVQTAATHMENTDLTIYLAR